MKKRELRKREKGKCKVNAHNFPFPRWKKRLREIDDDARGIESVRRQLRKKKNSFDAKARTTKTA